MAIKGYFNNIPSIEYGSKVARNLLARPIIKTKILANPTLIYDYTIQDGQRPDQIADAYYGNVNFVWLVFLVNNIVDPYYDWPLTSNQFKEFITDKYGSVEDSKNTTSTTNIVHYKHNTKGTIISKDSYDSGTYTWSKLYGQTGNYTAVRQYEYELELNEAKRDIKLIDRRVANKAFDVLREAMIENG